MNTEIYEKIIAKKELSQLPKRDVEKAFSHFENRQVSEEEKIRLTRELLHKVFGVFASRKLLSLKNKEPEWILRKHLSTRERLPHYDEVYRKVLSFDLTAFPPTQPQAHLVSKTINIIDLGAGINGFSYEFMEKVLQGKEKLHSQVRDIGEEDNIKTRGSSDIISNKKSRATLERGKLPKNIQDLKLNYLAVEAVGQLADLMNYYFKTRGLEAWAIHGSLFELDKIKKHINQVKGKKIVFLFKVLDSLEMLERNYSKKLLREIVPLVDRIVVSFATRSIGARKKFMAKRNWILDFMGKEFKVLDEFEIGGERYVVFKKK